MEVFKIISEFPNYEVSDSGNIKSIKTGRILIGGHDRNGYKCVNLRCNGKTYFKSIHRLVAITHIDNPDISLCVNHKDFNKENNHVSNLEFCNYYENNTHKKLKTNKASKYPGVSFCKTRQKFSSSIKVNGKALFLGRFETEIEAFSAYKKALEEHNIRNKYASNYSF